MGEPLPGCWEVVDCLNLWEVVGDLRSGGIPVWSGPDAGPVDGPNLLAHGAVIQEVDGVGECIQFQRLTGEGPDSGWVNIRVPQGGARLLERVDLVWRVVDKNGAAVTKDQATYSKTESAKLSCDAVVRELELDSGRLQFERLLGDGPDFGWVHLKLQGGKEVMRREATGPFGHAKEFGRKLGAPEEDGDPLHSYVPSLSQVAVSYE
mmetsp:Transcript_16832/g.47907  ORF Transcript_16832/g.47907 Transcript_16832/m.47907 type:complete len:207 (+) Transcript_16832:91-711(+)